MKKVLFIGWYPNPIEKYKNVFFQNLIFAMADQGVECTVISPVSYMRYKKGILSIPQTTQHFTPNGNAVQVHYPRVFSASSKQIGKYNTEKLTEKLFEKGAYKKALELVNSGVHFDAVYGHFFLYGGLAAIKIGRAFSIPSFVAFGECDYESQVLNTYGNLTETDINGLAGVISVSTKNARKLDELRIFRKIPYIIAPNAVDQSLFKKIDREKCREILNLDSDKFIVGFVGGFIERKGNKRLLSAVNQINDVYVAFAGVPGAGESIPEGERVLMAKPLEHSQIPILLNAVDVFCLPTLSEGSCNAVAEALSCGVPVISSDLEFNDDVLTGENSIRINPNSIDEIREAIIKLKNDPKLRENLSMAADATSECINIENRAIRILNFMGEIVNCNE